MIIATASRNCTLRRLGRARKLLWQALDQNLTIDQAAREAALSPGQFIRAFKAVFGQTPHQMRIDARLDLAKKLLITDNMPVTEICSTVGFASLGSFSHLFARRVGLSPTAFRREARVLVQVPGILPPRLFPGCLTLLWQWPADINFREANRPGL
jgi:AraC-like DNA-binding protein